MTPLCRTCQTRPAQPARAKIHDYICSRCWRQRPSAQRYQRSPKWQQRVHAYNHSAKGQARVRRYEATSHRRAMKAHYHQRLLRIGHRYVGMAATIAQADQIKAHITGRLCEFKSRQSTGAKAESVPAGAVPVEAGAGAD